MKRILIITLALLSLVLNVSAKIHTIGDSTMADYDQAEPDQKGMYGWGQVFGDYFSNGMTVKNWGDRGESARSFYRKFWSKTKAEIKKGDYVLIQFGHNDQKSVTTDVYREYLSRFICETRELGATPILVTSICRKLFEGTKISRLGRIDNGKAHGVDENNHTYDYPYHMKKVADSLKVECLDLTTACKEYMESWGPEGCKQFFPSGGSTHTNELGARVNAQLVAQLMYKANILKKYINISQISLPRNNGKITAFTNSKNESDSAEEDWNYYMVKTGADGFAVFGNLSGENLAVPEGLIAYGVIQGTEKHLVKLVKVGNVIPAQVGIIVRGKPNTEYSLTATTESPMFKRQKQNLLKVSEKTGNVKANENGFYNYLFTSERKKITFIPSDGKTQLRIKRAYLVSPDKLENITIERRQNIGNTMAK
jgi:lysophospholipase L1-like esterase